MRKVYCRRIKHKKQFLKTIKDYAMVLNDGKMLQKISEEETKSNSQLSYHGFCKLQYFAKYQILQKKPETNDWSTTRDFNKIAREQLLQYIDKEVCIDRKTVSLKFLETYYTSILLNLYQLEQMECTNMFTTNKLKLCIKSTFKKKIQIIQLANQLYIMSADIDIENIDDEEIENIIFTEEAKLFALKYRSHVLKIKKKNITGLPGQRCS